MSPPPGSNGQQQQQQYMASSMEMESGGAVESGTPARRRFNWTAPIIVLGKKNSKSISISISLPDDPL